MKSLTAISSEGIYLAMGGILIRLEWVLHPGPQGQIESEDMLMNNNVKKFSSCV